MTVSESSQPSGGPENHRTLRDGLRKLFGLCDNLISALGLAIVAVSLLLLITFALFSVVTGRSNRYLDVIGLLVVPGTLVLGLAIVPIGILWTRWRRRAGGPGPHIRIDLADPRTRGAALIFLAVTIFVVLPGLAVSSYEGYLYTESTEFCANVCHSVMEPQGVAHADSPHARVTCAACHIGEGAGWFVKSKLSGTRQVLAVWRETYSRPIPPAITELRPARDTCEECHWPAKFFGSQLKEVVHYSPDEANTRRVVRLLVKTGGADATIGRVEGIHMHMIVAGRIEYVARDEHLQEIPWVRYTRNDGTTSVYRDDGLPNDADPPEGIVRTIDCMDCHNRGAHHFRSPQTAVNLQLEAGRIDAGLPFIKREAVAALVGDYPDVATAEAEIQRRISTFYREQYPDVWREHQPAISEAITRVAEVYRRSFFPAMKVTWRSYPENIGHTIFPGCVRCHDGRHVNEAGQAINSDCTVCHVFLNAIEDRPGEFREGVFEHSQSLMLHKNLRCDQCHSGGVLRLCYDCHNSGEALENWRRGRLRRFGDE